VAAVRVVDLVIVMVEENAILVLVFAFAQVAGKATIANYPQMYAQQDCVVDMEIVTLIKMHARA
jgi:hypothetical protein